MAVPVRSGRVGLRSLLWLGGLFSCSLLGIIPTHAYVYPVPLDGVSTEEEAYELYYEGNLEEAELERIKTLLQDPVDINEADRDELYDLPGLTWPMVDALIAHREKIGRFKNLKELALVPELPRDVLQELRPFVVVRKPLTSRDYLRSDWQLKVGWAPFPMSGGETSEVLGSGIELQTDIPPTFYLRSDNLILRWLSMGFALTESQQLGELYYRDELPIYETDPKSKKYGTERYQLPGYLTEGRVTRFDLAKIYLHTPKNRYTRWSAIVGSYRIGFGMGLVFDNTSKEFPKGWIPDRELSTADEVNQVSPPRYKDDPGLFGVAASLHRLDLGPVFLSGHAFSSSIFRDPYQEFRNDVTWLADESKTRQNEARSLYLCQMDADGECAFSVDERTGDTNYKVANPTLIDGLQENTFGGNLNLHLDAKSQIGISAYKSQVVINPEDRLFADQFDSPRGGLLDHKEGYPLQLTPSSMYPDDRSEFWAVGGHIFWGLGDFMARGEGAYLDNGAYALWLRGFYSFGKLQTELGGRIYSEDHDNRWSSPYAQADTLNGNRARDEQGINYRISFRPLNGLSLNLKGDLWRRERSQCWIENREDEDDPDRLVSSATDCQEAEENPKKTASYNPIDSTFQELRINWNPTSLLRLTLKGSLTDKDLSRSGRGESYESGSGMKLSLYGKADLKPLSWLRLTAGYRVAWVDDPGPRSLFVPSRYRDYMDVDPDGRTYSRVLVDPEPTDACWSRDSKKATILDDDGVPVPAYSPGTECDSLFANRFRLDYYSFYEIEARHGLTTGTIKFKYSDEALGYASVVGSSGSYWQLSVKLKQAKTFDLISGSLRYDLIKYVDDRVKWYIYDLRDDYRDELLFSRYNHLFTLNLGVSF